MEALERHRVSLDEKINRLISQTYNNPRPRGTESHVHLEVFELQILERLHEEALTSELTRNLAHVANVLSSNLAALGQTEESHDPHGQLMADLVNEGLFQLADMAERVRINLHKNAHSVHRRHMRLQNNYGLNSSNASPDGGDMWWHPRRTKYGSEGMKKTKNNNNSSTATAMGMDGNIESDALRRRTWTSLMAVEEERSWVDRGRDRGNRRSDGLKREHSLAFTKATPFPKPQGGQFNLLHEPITNNQAHHSVFGRDRVRRTVEDQQSLVNESEIIEFTDSLTHSTGAIPAEPKTTATTTTTTTTISSPEQPPSSTQITARWNAILERLKRIQAQNEQRST